MTPQAVLDEIKKDTDFYEESGGGATFSGGEPLAQPQFLSECLGLCRAAGISTAIDTSGWCNPKTLEGMAGLADLFLYDLKLIDSARHREWTGVPSQPILENLSLLAAIGARVWIRIPVIPGVNAGSADMAAAADFIVSLGKDYPVSLLPFHDSARGKYSLRGESWESDRFRVPTPEELERTEKIFLDRGLTIRRGG